MKRSLIEETKQENERINKTSEFTNEKNMREWTRNKQIVKEKRIKNIASFNGMRVGVNEFDQRCNNSVYYRLWEKLLSCVRTHDLNFIVYYYDMKKINPNFLTNIEQDVILTMGDSINKWTFFTCHSCNSLCISTKTIHAKQQ